MFNLLPDRFGDNDVVVRGRDLIERRKHRVNTMTKAAELKFYIDIECRGAPDRASKTFVYKESAVLTSFAVVVASLRRRYD